jgi:hypothetical protein
MSAVLVFLAAVGAGLSTLLRPGSIVVMVPVEGGCSVVFRWGSAARVAVPGAGAGILGDGAKVGQLGAECCHLAGKVLDTLQKCVALGE